MKKRSRQLTKFITCDMNSTSMTKQAERSFFPGSTMPMPSTERSAPVPEGGIYLTPEQLEYIRAGDKAWVEGFNEGLAGALAGDGYRGVARGALNTTADTIDEFVDPPARLATSPLLLLGHILTAATGSTKAEDKIRAGRDAILKWWNLIPHSVTSGMRQVADSKALDPKYLTNEAYNESVRAGKLGAIAAELVATKNIPGSFWWKYFIPVTTGDAVITTIDDNLQAVKTEKRQQAGHDALVDYFKKRTEMPAGPFIAHVPKIERNFINDLAINEAANDPEGSEILERIENDAENIDYHRALKQLKQMGKQVAGTGVGGLVGLTAAHQITKRIPALQKRKILRYLINSLATVGGGYVGYRLMEK